MRPRRFPGTGDRPAINQKRVVRRYGDFDEFSSLRLEQTGRIAHGFNDNRINPGFDVLPVHRNPNTAQAFSHGAEVVRYRTIR